MELNIQQQEGLLAVAREVVEQTGELKPDAQYGPLLVCYNVPSLSSLFPEGKRGRWSEQEAPRDLIHNFLADAVRRFSHEAYTVGGYWQNHVPREVLCFTRNYEGEELKEALHFGIGTWTQGLADEMTAAKARHEDAIARRQAHEATASNLLNQHFRGLCANVRQQIVALPPELTPERVEDLAALVATASSDTRAMASNDLNALDRIQYNGDMEGLFRLIAILGLKVPPLQ